MISHELSALVNKYRDAFTQIQSRLEALSNERKHLLIIANNIAPDRDFKLTMEQLTAFGFDLLEE